jgi:hypothetical protein
VTLRPETTILASARPAGGTKHPLAPVEGSTENTTLVRELLVGLRERGLDTTRPILAVLDGAKALAAGVRQVFDQPVISRCQLHKLRNVRDKLPEKMRSDHELFDAVHQDVPRLGRHSPTRRGHVNETPLSPYPANSHRAVLRSRQTAAIHM